MCRLPGQTNGATGKRDVVTRLDPVKILEEEAATSEHCLGVVLRLQELRDRLGAGAPERAAAVHAVALPESACALPAVAYPKPGVARGPRVTQGGRGGLDVEII